MNYTPNDLQNLVFKKMFMGYGEDQVNEVLDRVIEDYSAYIKENLDLKDKLALLNESLQNYKIMEESLQNTLVVAQQTSEEIRKNAYEKADNIIKEAEVRAQQILNTANQEVIRIKFEYEDMRKRLQVFKTKAETLLQSQLEVIRQIFEES